MTQGGAGRGLVRGLEGRGLAAGGVRVVRTTGCPVRLSKPSLGGGPGSGQGHCYRLGSERQCSGKSRA